MTQFRLVVFDYVKYRGSYYFTQLKLGIRCISFKSKTKKSFATARVRLLGRFIFKHNVSYWLEHFYFPVLFSAITKSPYHHFFVYH